MMIRLALIGCPRDAACYARVAPRLRGARIAAIADRDGRRAHQCAQAVDADVWTDDIDRLLDKHAATYDAVVIHDFSQQYFATCRAAIRAGKHLLLQGPLPDSAAAMTQLVAGCDGAGVRLMVGNSLRFLPSVRTVKQNLDSGRLGDPGCLRMHRWTPSQQTEPSAAAVPSPASFASRLLCRHFGEVDAVCWLFGGAPAVVYATGFQGTGSESGLDYVQLHLGFGDHGMALLDVAQTLPHGDGYFALTLVGSTGAAYADDHHNMQLLFSGGRPAAVNAGQGDEPLRGEVQEFVQAIAERREPLLTGADGLRAIKVIEAAVESLVIRQSLHRVGQQERAGDGHVFRVPRFATT